MARKALFLGLAALGLLVASPINAQIRLIERGQTVFATIDPPGAIHHYRFMARAGDVVRIETWAERLSPRSSLDTVVSLLTAEPNLVLAVNDDIEFNSVTDSRLIYVLPSTGEYLIKVESFESYMEAESIGGSGFRYQLQYSIVANQSALHFPHVADGDGFRSSILLINSSGSVANGAINLIDTSGNALLTVLDGQLSSSFPFSVPAQGVHWLETENVGSLKPGSAQLTTNNPGLVASVIFGFNQNSIFVGEASVPSSRMYTNAMIFVDQNETERVGIAVANPNGQAARVTFSLVSADGLSIVGRATRIIPSYGQLARFISELIPNPPERFQGSLSVESNQPVALIAIKETVNERGDVLMSTFPIGSVGDQGSAPLVFPQVADGNGFKTRIILTNPTNETMAGNIRLYSTQGTELNLRFGDRTSSQFIYAVPPGGVFSMVSSGEGSLRAGYAQVMPIRGQTPVGSVFFSFNQQGTTVSEAGVADARPSRQAKLYVEFSQRRNTGFAIANPNDVRATVTAILRTADSRREISRIQLDIPARGHRAAFLNELIRNLPSAFNGVLDLESNINVAVTAIRSTINQRSHFLMSTLPIAN